MYPGRAVECLYGIHALQELPVGRQPGGYIMMLSPELNIDACARQTQIESGTGGGREIWGQEMGVSYVRRSNKR